MSFVETLQAPAAIEFQTTWRSTDLSSTATLNLTGTPHLDIDNDTPAMTPEVHWRNGVMKLHAYTLAGCAAGNSAYYAVKCNPALMSCVCSLAWVQVSDVHRTGRSRKSCLWEARRLIPPAYIRQSVQGCVFHPQRREGRREHDDLRQRGRAVQGRSRAPSAQLV
ncbi:unnamed protein product, partial [Mycena citricolor]